MIFSNFAEAYDVVRHLSKDEKTMAGLHFDITGDNTNLLRKLQETENGVRSVSRTVEKEGGNIEDLFNRLARSAAAIGVGFSAKEFISKAAQIRGEFQKLEVAFTTMLGSKEQAEKLMEQMIRTAATTPFSLQDVAGGAKQLLAYGIEAERVNETLIRLGDIAAGLSIPLGDLVYLYGTTRAQGRLYTEDFNQFTSRGIPMIEMLADKFGVAESEVKGLVEAGKVGFPEVQEVIEKLTNEGGKFGGLMEAQSKTIAGQISNIEDAIETMFNEIGKANEGVINEALSGVSYLVENYEKVGREVLAVAAAYGTYRAVLMSVAAYQSVMVGVTYSTEIAELSKLIPLKQQSANEDIIAAVAAGRLTTAKAEQVIAIRTEIEAKRSSMQATLAAAQADTAAAQAAYKSALQRSVASKQAYAAKLKELEASKAYYANEALYNAAKTQQLSALADERSAAAKAKKVAAQNLEIARSKQNVAATALETFNTQANTAAQTANARSTNLLTVAKTKLAAASKALGLSMLANPYVVTAAAVTALGYGIYKLVTYQTDAEKAQSKLNDAIKESEKASLSEQRELAKLKGELSALTKGTDEYNDVKDKIIKGYSKYYDGLDEEIEKVGLTEQAYLKLTDAITKAFGARQYEKFKESQQEELDNLLSDNLSKIQDRLIQKLGEEQGAKFYTKIRNAVLSGNVKSINGTYNLSGLDNETKAALDKVAGKKEGKFYIANRDVEKYILNIVNAINATEKLDKLAKERFGIGDTSSQDTNQNKQVESEESNYQKDYDAAKKAWEEAKKKLEEIDKNKKAFTSKQYEDAKTDYDDKKKKYESLGGITSDKAINDAKKRAEEEKKAQEQLAEALLQLRFQNQQDEINLMEEGSEKKRKQIELDYQKEIDAYNKAKAKYGETDEVKQMKTLADEKRKEGLSGLVEEEQQKLQSMLEKYQDYAAQREAIEKQLNEDITYLETQRTEENSANIDRAIKVAKEKAAKAVKEITDEESKALVNDSSIFARLFSDSSSMTKASLKKVIAEAKTLVDYLSGISIEKPLGFTEDQLEALKGDAESIKEIYDALIEKQDELDKRTDYPFDGIVKGFKKIKDSAELAKKAIEETDEEKKKLLQSQSEAEYGKGVSYLKEGALEASDAVGFLSEQVAILAEATGDSKFKEFSDQFSAFSQNLQAAGQGAQSGGWIGAIVGGVSNMITQTVASMAQLQVEAQEYEQNRIDFLRELEQISLTLKDENYDSIFGTSSIERARDAYKLAQEALQKYNEELQKTSALEIEEEYKNLGAAIFAPIFGSFGFGKRISEETKALMAAYEKGYTDLQAMAVKTKDRSGWANFWGKKDEYTALKDLAPELWNEDGTFNVEAAQAFLDTNTQISDEQRKQIQNVIDLKNAYDENISIIDELLASTFGSLGSDITDIIFDSVRNGTDAWEQFREVGSGVIDELGRQMIQELYVQTYLETFKERMRAAYGLDSVEDTQKELANIMNDIYNGLEGVLNGASSAAEEWDKWAKDHGFTPGEEDTESSSQTATSKGFTTMSQDTADELNGRFTALYEVGLQILQNISSLQSISVSAQSSDATLLEIKNLMILSNGHLEDISTFAKKILDGFGKKLDDINANLKNAL